MDSQKCSLNLANKNDGQISCFSDDFHILFNLNLCQIDLFIWSQFNWSLSKVLNPVCQSQISRKVSFSRQKQIWMSHLPLQLCHSALWLGRRKWKHKFASLQVCKFILSNVTSKQIATVDTICWKLEIGNWRQESVVPSIGWVQTHIWTLLNTKHSSWDLKWLRQERLLNAGCYSPPPV